jgi:hypothetical protein
MTSHIKDILKNLVSYAVPLNFNTIRVTGVAEGTLFEAVREEGSVIIMKAASSTPIEEFIGTFGMPGLKILKGYVDTFSSMEEIDDKSGSNVKIEIQRNYKPDPTVPTDIQFSTPGSTAIYRLQKDNLPRQPNMKEGVKWDAEVVQPSRSKITEFSSFASILSDVEKSFSVKTVGSFLKFYIGDENSSTSKVNFVFADGIKSKITTQVHWVCNDFLTIMNLAASADTVVKFSNLGVIQITVDTGIMTYDFMLPGVK